MLHRTAVTLIAICSALTVSSVAHADVVCGDYLSGAYQPDEMTTAASQALATDLRECVCYADCAASCMTYDAVEGNYACGIGGDPAFAVQGGDQSTCNACIQQSCSSLFLACYFDG